VSNDHSTDSGLQNVYDGASAKQVVPKPKQRPAPVQASAHHKTNPVTLEATAQRAPALSAEEFADKRNAAPKAPKKQ
jgi:hypothetical protein